MITRPKTIICDIDGVIFKHKGDITKLYNDKPKILPGVLEKLKKWDLENCNIILMTGRRESTRKETEKQLSNSGIFYDKLIMGVGGGIRVLINDRKPNGDFTTKTYCLERNKGLGSIDKSVDEGKDNFIPKPWGSETIIETNKSYTVKKLFMRTGHKCSLQYHKKKHETIYILDGIMNLWVGIDENSIEHKILNIGDTYVIKPGIVHRMESLDDCYYLESSTSELDDVVRLQDEYGRT
jgi:mannose-6-phosphate isomerase-like protein (cupin superfamily)